MKSIQIEGSGTYQLIIKGADGNVRYKSEEIKNLILNQGIDRFMSNQVYDDYAFCGTGGTPPLPTDVSMQAFLAETNDRSGNQNESVFTSPRYLVQKLTYSFAVGAVVGNVAEVGIGWKVSSTRFPFSRALVVDGGGSPTTITVLASEQLTIIYRFYVKVPDTDTTFNVVDNGVTYTVTQRPNFPSSPLTGYQYIRYGFYGYVGGARDMWTKATDVLPAIEDPFSQSGTSSATTVALGAYTPGSFTRTINYTFGSDRGNFAGGIGSAYARTGESVGFWMYSFSPKINKITGQSLTLSFNYTFVRGTPP